MHFAFSNSFDVDVHLAHASLSTASSMFVDMAIHSEAGASNHSQMPQSLLLQKVWGFHNLPSFVELNNRQCHLLKDN